MTRLFDFGFVNKVRCYCHVCRDGYVLPGNSAGSELLRAIREVVRGGFYITPLMTKGMVGSFVLNFKRMKNKNPLTIRQKEVLQLLAEGRSMKEAAFKLKVSPRTVAYHKYTMMEQLHIRSSAEPIEFAMRSSLVAA